MRIYDGSPRQDYEEVLRSIGAYLDGRGMREVLLLEAPDGFIVQGLVAGSTEGKWSDSVGHVDKETVTFLDEDIGKFMDEAIARRGSPPPPEHAFSGHYEDSLRVIGRYIDSERARDVFFFEQGGAFVVRLLRTNQTGSHHDLAEFTAEDVAGLIAQGPSLRVPPKGEQGSKHG